MSTEPPEDAAPPSTDRPVEPAAVPDGPPPGQPHDAAPQPPHGTAPQPPHGSAQQPPYGVQPQPPYGTAQQPPYGVQPQPPYGPPPQPSYGPPPQPLYGAPPQPPYGPPPQRGALPPGPPPVPVDRPPTPWWAGVLAVLGVLLVVAVVLGAVGAVVLEAATRTVTAAVDEQGVRTLRVVGLVGGASISTDPDADGAVTGRAEMTTSWVDAELDVRRDGDELVLEVSCPDQSWPRRCDVGYDLLVDPDVDVVVDIVTGGLEAEGLAGDVDVSMTTGGVLLTDLTSERVDVDVTTGGVALSFDEAPRAVGVTTTTGGIGIGLPDDGLPYDVRTSVSVGQAAVGVPVDGSSARTVTASTTIGGIDISSAADWDADLHVDSGVGTGTGATG